MSETFDDYRAQLLLRHQHGTTSTLSTVGDVVMAGGILAGAVSRRVPVALLGVTVGFGIAAVAHLFQPGTLRDEVVAVVRHPVWSLKAETQRVFGGAHV
jgi:hypothetical protein